MPFNKHPIAEHLSIVDGAEYDLDLLYKLQNACKNAPYVELLAFYSKYKNIEFKIYGNQFSCGEIVRKMADEKTEDILYSVLKMDQFCILNDCKSLMVSGNEVENKTEIDQSILNSLNDSNKSINSSNKQYKLLGIDAKALAVIERGLLTPKIFNIGSARLKLKPETFQFHLENGIDIPALMAYDISYDEMSSLFKRMNKDESLSNGIEQHLISQGCHNSTMFLISKFFKNQNLKIVYHQIDFEKIESFMCAKHSDGIFHPFEYFKSISQACALPLYFLYLFHKQSINEDADEIQLLISQNWPLLSDFDGSTLIGIVDLSFKSGLKLEPTNLCCFLLSFLEDEPYFRKYFGEYAPKFVRSQIKLVKYVEELEKVRGILERLDQTDLKEGLSSELDYKQLATSQPEDAPIDTAVNPTKDVLITANMPFLDFTIHVWLSNDSKLVLLEEYFQHFNINQLIDNIHTLDLDSFSLPFISNWLIDSLEQLNCKVKKGITMCSLGMEITSDMFTKSEVKSIYKVTKRLFSLYKILVVDDTRVYLPYLKKMMNSLSLSEENTLQSEMNSEIFLNSVSLEFSIIYIQAVCPKYDLTCIYKQLDQLLDRFQSKIALTIQKYIIHQINELFIDEKYLDLISRLYKKMLAIPDIKIQKGNEKILALIIKSANMLGKSIFVGNIK